MEKIIEKIREELAEMQETDSDFIEHVVLLFSEGKWIYGSAVDSEHEEEIWFRISSNGRIEKSPI
jgi:hypothetical protein